MPIHVNHQVLEDQWIRDEAAILKDRLRAEMPDLDDLTFGIRLREIAREQVIRRMLLEQAAASGLLEETTGRVPRPNKQEVAAYYRKFPQFFQAPETVRAAHIVKNVDENTTEEQAEAAILKVEEELKAGADFAALADRCSDCPGQGGDLGFFARGEMVEEFEQAAFALKPGERSGVFRSVFGFHIAKVLEKRPAGLRPLSEVRERIEHGLWQDRKERAGHALLQELRAKAEIRKV
jgi:parvulin-like peptidyl-prolyl isomerase